MDLEPGRCRRTNGNKWRCRKNSVPDQKYVDASQIANLLGTNSPNDSQNLKAIITNLHTHHY